MHGAHNALHPHDWRMYPTRAEVRVLEPVPTAGLTMDDLDSLREGVRDRIAAEVKLMAEPTEPFGCAWGSDPGDAAKGGRASGGTIFAIVSGRG